MSLDLISAIHVAIAAALVESPPAIAAGRVYDLGAVPDIDEKGFNPYVVIGNWSATAADDKGAGAEDDGLGFDYVQWIDVWGQTNRGKKDVETIMAAVYAALHEQPMPLSGSPLPGHVVTFRCEYQDLILDGDPLRIHGRLRFESYAHTA